MPTSRDRILTTHVGSLPRPPELVDALRRHERGEPQDGPAFEGLVAQSVEAIVATQVSLGLDLVNDGEASKPSYSTYIQERLTGFGVVEPERLPLERHRERETFVDYYKRTGAAGGSGSRRKLACVGPVAIRDRAPLHRDLANFRAAVDRAKPVGAFMTAASPGVIARFHPNLHYGTSQAYREAIGAAMREEYEAIVTAGFLLQVDCPDLASGWTNAFADAGEQDFIRECEISVEILNDALRGVPADRVRLHLCWGNYEGPHVHDIALEKILPTVLKAKPQTLSLEGANPRHAHEWEVWQRVALPDDKILMPGVLDTLSNYVEHPELVAQRIGFYADAVGRERVIASTDCGFETFMGHGRVHPSIVWKKFEAMAEGARRASDRLWGRRPAAS
jgi:5-methyltetrahydropteroyltriglutamate--homocysteine methyltransferase